VATALVHVISGETPEARIKADAPLAPPVERAAFTEEPAAASAADAVVEPTPTATADAPAAVTEPSPAEEPDSDGESEGCRRAGGTGGMIR
jgi:hypothetical protein